ncbi:MAG: hypothetical protein ACTHM7_01130 [Ginsengibacter sp.]
MITISNIQTETSQFAEERLHIDSLGLVIPFQPAIVEKKTIQTIFEYALYLVQLKLERKFEQPEINRVVKRLENIFYRLNYNSHRKSVAIIMEGGDEKIIYLNYSGKLVFQFNETFSLLDLVGNATQNPEFELLVFKNEGAELYEYFNHSLHRVFAQTNSFCGKHEINNCLIKRISNILKQINSKNEKPVFVYSVDGQYDEGFCRNFCFKEIAFKIHLSQNEETTSTVELLVEKIIAQWKYYQNKLIKGQIKIAKKADLLISELPNVLDSLKKGDDGLLLMDGFMKDEIHNKSTEINFEVAAQKLSNEIEKFLARGNRIEITEGGLLGELEGIALIKDEGPAFEIERATRIYNIEEVISY